MAYVPSRRLLVYVVAGIIVLLVGTIGLLSLRADSPKGEVLRAEIPAGEIPGGGIPSTDGLSPAAWDPASGALGFDGVDAAAPTTITTAMIYVQVAGAVRRPGVYRVPSDARVFQAVTEAGGFTDEADQQALTLAAQLKDGCRVYVPRVGETVADPVKPSVEGDGSIGEGGSQVISLNSATLEQLDSLPGIGPAIAQDIISFREAHGPFTSVDQLTDVPGIGPARLEQLRPLVGL